jgi:WD and tetratricopeptide repeat-containing protein 1
MSTPSSQSTSKRTCKTKEDFSEHNFQKIEDMCRKFMQVATRSLEMGKNLMHGIDACSEVLESVGPDIDDNIRHDCLCTRAGLYLKRKWKNDVYMAIRDCNRARNIDRTSYQAHLYMSEALLQVSICESV